LKSGGKTKPPALIYTQKGGHSLNTITKITLENFQSHIKTNITPAENGQLTTIVGPSDTGKTSILRALRWVFYNSPSGTDFIRAGATYAKVIVEYASGDVVTRWRSTGGINRYIVNEAVYEGFGNSVPLEVKEVTGVNPVVIGDIELCLNFAEQLDGPFLGKSVSAPARAKVLGKLAGTEEIDLAGKRLGTDLYRQGQDEKRLKAELEGLQEKIAGYDYLPAMKKKIKALETIITEIKEAKERQDKLVALNEDYSRTETGIQETMDTINRWKGIREAEANIREAEKTTEKMRVIETLGINAIRIKTVINEALTTINRFSGIEEAEYSLAKAFMLTARKDALLRLQVQYKDYEEQREAARKIVKKYQGIKEAESLIIRTEETENYLKQLGELAVKHKALWDKSQEKLKTVIFYEERIQKLIKTYQKELETLGICPLCGQSTKNKDLNLKEVI
jgi:hypothetical protein